ncbi:MAG TPA: hypothetical protein DCG54_09390, partial [Anaerolineae bacterium]|nr:hypothetical protein [Anaerolineae bacterium]
MAQAFINSHQPVQRAIGRRLADQKTHLQENGHGDKHRLGARQGFKSLFDLSKTERNKTGGKEKDK